jgi:hypothetical protein
MMLLRLSLLTDPLPWVFVASVFLGAAASRATRRTANRTDPHRAWTRKWVFFCLWLSLGLLTALGAVLVPGSERLLTRGTDGVVRLVEPLLPWVAIAGFLVSLLATRFRKSLGIPVVVVLLVAVIALGLFFQSVRAFTGETEVASVRALAVADGKMRLEVLPQGQLPQLVDLEGDQFAPVVKVIIFDDLWVFLGARTWYRFVGLVSFTTRNGLPVQSATTWAVPHPVGISDTIWSWFEANEERVPGVKTVQTELVLKKVRSEARSLGSWSVRVQNDGGVEVVPLSD